MGGQIITYFIGQCGCQIANACWELYCLEHSISPNGKYYDDNIPDDSSPFNFFSESMTGQFVPRSLFVDLEPTVIDEIKIGSYRKLYNADNLINGFDDAANNFARGFYSCGKYIVKAVVNNTRKLAEKCDDIHAFMAHHSFGGGTGSGFTSMVLEYLAVEFSKTTKIEFNVFPSPALSVAVVEPYNAILAMHTPMENADIAAFFENESLYKICSDNLNIDAPLFTHLNRMAAQVISGMTCSMRFEGVLNANLIDFQTNLIPYPRIHFPLVSFCPFTAQSKARHRNMSTKQITTEAFLKDNQMTSTSPIDGTNVSCCLLFRGDVNIREVNEAISFQKAFENMKWVDWCPTGFKVGINHQPMLAIPSSGLAYSSRSVTLLCNSSSVKDVIRRLNYKFMLMFNNKSFIHWYVAEGMEEDEFIEASEDVLTLEKDFESLEENSYSNSNQNESDGDARNPHIYKENNNNDISAFQNLPISAKERKNTTTHSILHKNLVSQYEKVLASNYDRHLELVNNEKHLKSEKKDHYLSPKTKSRTDELYALKDIQKFKSKSILSFLPSSNFPFENKNLVEGQNHVKSIQCDRHDSRTSKRTLSSSACELSENYEEIIKKLISKNSVIRCPYIDSYNRSNNCIATPNIATPHALQNRLSSPYGYFEYRDPATRSPKDQNHALREYCWYSEKKEGIPIKAFSTLNFTSVDVSI